MIYALVRVGPGRSLTLLADIRGWLSDGDQVSILGLARGCSLRFSFRRTPGSIQQATRRLENGSRLSPGRRLRVGYGALAGALLLLLPAVVLAAAPQPAPLTAQDN